MESDADYTPDQRAVVAWAVTHYYIVIVLGKEKELANGEQNCNKQKP
jgi:hypothetical protein